MAASSSCSFFGGPRQRLTKFLSRWGHRNHFPAALWRSLLGQTLARCVALRKQVVREVALLRSEAAEYLQSGLLPRAEDKIIFLLSFSVLNSVMRQRMLEKIAVEFNINWKIFSQKLSVSSNLLATSSTKELSHQASVKKFTKDEAKQGNFKCIPSPMSSDSNIAQSPLQTSQSRHNKVVQYYEGKAKSVASSTSKDLAKSFGKKCVLAPSSLKRSYIKSLYKPSYGELNKTKSLYPGVKETSHIAKESGNTKPRPAAIMHLPQCPPAAHEPQKLSVGSDNSYTNEGKGRPAQLCRRPSQLPQYEEVKARLLSLKKKRQDT